MDKLTPNETMGQKLMKQFRRKMKNNIYIVCEARIEEDYWYKKKEKMFRKKREIMKKNVERQKNENVGFILKSCKW